MKQNIHFACDIRGQGPGVHISLHNEWILSCGAVCVMAYTNKYKYIN